MVAFAVWAAACGATSGSSASPSPSPEPPSTPSVSPGPGGLIFKLTPEPGVTATGTITVTTAPGSATVEVKVAGLQANSAHVSHIHLGSCQQRGAIARALNPVVANGQGDADAKSTLNLTYPPAGGTWYVVVHAGPDMQGSNASYLLCGNLFS